MAQKQWWQDFFSGLAVDMWKQAIPEEQTRSELEFFRTAFGVQPPAKILDVPSGSGRLTLGLAEMGFRMTGLDISPAFLGEARQESAKRKLNVHWEERDMRDLPWQAEFDGILCWGNSFGYLDDEGNASFLRSAFRALKPGGTLALDASSVAEAILPRYQDRTWSQVGNILFLEENRYDHELSRLDTEYTFIRNGKTEKKTGSHRIYTYRELCRLLEDTGFGSYEAFGSVNREAFTMHSPGLLLIARKK